MDQRTRNAALIAEFRANGGTVAEDKFAGAPLLLLTTRGRKTGRPYTTPLMYLPDGGRFVVFASHGGAPEDPEWYRNLVSAGRAVVEVGGRAFAVTVVATHGAERDRLYATHASLYPRFGEYELKTTRRIPVVALVPDVSIPAGGQSPDGRSRSGERDAQPDHR